jgi:hypothetical protein
LLLLLGRQMKPTMLLLSTHALMLNNAVRDITPYLLA